MPLLPKEMQYLQIQNTTDIPFPILLLLPFFKAQYHLRMKKKKKVVSKYYTGYIEGIEDLLFLLESTDRIFNTWSLSLYSQNYDLLICDREYESFVSYRYLTATCVAVVMGRLHVAHVIVIRVDMARNVSVMSRELVKALKTAMGMFEITFAFSDNNNDRQVSKWCYVHVRAFM